MARTVNINQLYACKNLLYSIQMITGQETDQILNKLYELALCASTETLRVSRARQLTKRILFDYPATRLTIQLNLDSMYYKFLEDSGNVPVTAKFTFPQDVSRFDLNQITQMANELQELELGLSDKKTEWAKFTKPESKIPKVLRGVLK